MAQIIWPDPSGKLSPAEMMDPEHVHPDLVRALGLQRLDLGKPMFLTRLVSGQLRHPQGDAVPPYSAAHADASLHKYGIDHMEVADSLEGYVEAPGALGLAQDWDCGVQDADGLFAVYVDHIERLAFDFAPYRWGGIGLYPDWQNPGYHTDLRGLGHPSFGARWFRVQDTYHQLTWANWKREVLQRG